MGRPAKCHCGECGNCRKRARYATDAVYRQKLLERVKAHAARRHPGERRRRPTPPPPVEAPVRLTAEMRDAIRRAIDERVRKRAGVQ